MFEVKSSAIKHVIEVINSRFANQRIFPYIFPSTLSIHVDTLSIHVDTLSIHVDNRRGEQLHFGNK